MKRLRGLPRAAAIAALVLLVALPATGAQRPGDRSIGLAHLSQSVQFHYYMAHPNLAPPQLAAAVRRQLPSREVDLRIEEASVVVGPSDDDVRIALADAHGLLVLREADVVEVEPGGVVGVGRRERSRPRAIGRSA